jgi:hypothetical protein
MMAGPPDEPTEGAWDVRSDLPIDVPTRRPEGRRELRPERRLTLAGCARSF